MDADKKDRVTAALIKALGEIERPATAQDIYKKAVEDTRATFPWFDQKEFESALVDLIDRHVFYVKHTTLIDFWNR